MQLDPVCAQMNTQFSYDHIECTNAIDVYGGSRFLGVGNFFEEEFDGMRRQITSSIADGSALRGSEAR